MINNKLNTIVIIVVIFGFIFQACAQKSNNDKSNNEQSSNSKDIEIDYDKIGQQLMQNDWIGDLKISLALDKVTGLLGSPNEMTKLELWEADGAYHHKLIYKDKGVELDMVGDSLTRQKIGMITIFEPCAYKTKENIGIGSSIKDIKSTYKDAINPNFSDSNSIVVGSIYGGLIFKIKNDKVIRIILGSAAI